MNQSNIIKRTKTNTTIPEPAVDSNAEKQVSKILVEELSFFYHNWENVYTIKTAFETVSEVSRYGYSQRRAKISKPRISLSEKCILLSAIDAQTAAEVIKNRNKFRFLAPIQSERGNIESWTLGNGTMNFFIGGSLNPIWMARATQGQYVAITSPQKGTENTKVDYFKIFSIAKTSMTRITVDGVAPSSLFTTPTAKEDNPSSAQNSTMTIQVTPIFNGGAAGTPIYYFKGDTYYNGTQNPTDNTAHTTINSVTFSNSYTENSALVAPFVFNDSTNMGLGGVSVSVGDCLIITVFMEGRAGHALSLASITSGSTIPTPPSFKLRGIQTDITTAVSYTFTNLLGISGLQYWDGSGSTISPYGSQGSTPTVPTIDEILNTKVYAYAIKITQAMINAHGNRITCDFGIKRDSLGVRGSPHFTIELSVYKDVDVANIKSYGSHTTQNKRRTLTSAKVGNAYSNFTNWGTSGTNDISVAGLIYEKQLILRRKWSSGQVKSDGTSPVFQNNATLSYFGINFMPTIAFKRQYTTDADITIPIQILEDNFRSGDPTYDGSSNILISSSSQTPSRSVFTKTDYLYSSNNILQTGNSDYTNNFNDGFPTVTYYNGIEAIPHAFDLMLYLGGNSNSGSGYSIFPCLECDPISDTSMEFETSTIASLERTSYQTVGTESLEHVLGILTFFDIWESSNWLPSYVFTNSNYNSPTNTYESFSNFPLLDTEQNIVVYESSPKTTAIQVNTISSVGVGRSIESYPQIKSGIRFNQTLKFVDKVKAYRFIKFWYGRFGRCLPFWAINHGSKYILKGFSGSNAVIQVEGAETIDTDSQITSQKFIIFYATTISEPGLFKPYLLYGYFNETMNATEKYFVIKSWCTPLVYVPTSSDLGWQSGKPQDDSATQIHKIASLCYAAHLCYFASDELEERWTTDSMMECDIELEEDTSILDADLTGGFPNFRSDRAINPIQASTGCGLCNDQNTDSSGMCSYINNGRNVGFYNNCCGCISMSTYVTITIYCFGDCSATSYDDDPANPCTIGIGNLCNDNGSVTLTLRMKQVEFDAFKSGGGCSGTLFFYGGDRGLCYGTSGDPTVVVGLDTVTGELFIQSMETDSSECYAGCGGNCNGSADFLGCTGKPSCSGISCTRQDYVEACQLDKLGDVYRDLGGGWYYTWKTQCKTAEYRKILCCAKCALCGDPPSPCFSGDCKDKLKATIVLVNGTYSSYSTDTNCGYSKAGCTAPTIPVTVGLVPKRNGILYGIPWSYEGNNNNGEAYAAP